MKKTEPFFKYTGLQLKTKFRMQKNAKQRQGQNDGKTILQKNFLKTYTNAQTHCQNVHRHQCIINLRSHAQLWISGYNTTTGLHAQLLSSKVLHIFMRNHLYFKNFELYSCFFTIEVLAQSK
jgi:hypothetical protein